MNRRSFLKTSAAAAAAGPIFLGTTARAMNNSPVIGVDGHKYECNHNWGQLPNDYEWQTTHNVAIDSQGHVYITHQGVGKKMDTVLVFDGHDKFVRSFGKEFTAARHDIEIRKEGSDEFCYLSNTWTPDLKLMKTTLKGELIWKKGRPECKEYEDKKRAYNPTNICFADGGLRGR
ncbi:MAG: twin-arginine translocation signal domain-containing protein [Gemmataceae bacterium]